MRANYLLSVVVLAVITAALVPASSAAAGPELLQPVGRDATRLPSLSVPGPAGEHMRSGGSDTLWFFDADFETESGDNAGWEGFDNTGHPESPSFWHPDTVRTPLSRPYLGDYAWWCGTYPSGECWVGGRGYANRWISILERDFPEVDAHSNPGDQLQLEWDQRYAMEHDYDYGYVEVSTNGGGSWTTLATYTNSGFAGYPGTPMNWGGANGHPVLDMDAYAGAPDLRLRFRFVSDDIYSTYESTVSSLVDGAWEIDNIKWSAGTPLTQFWLDNSEPGTVQEWETPLVPAYGQVGATFQRYLYPWELDEGGGEYCGQPWEDTHVWAAVNPGTQEMVNDQDSWLVSPEIHPPVEGPLVVYWRVYADCPSGTNDFFDMYARTDSLFTCEEGDLHFLNPTSGGWYGDHLWADATTTIDEQYTTDEWLKLAFRLMNYEPLANPDDHGRGLFVDRVRVGVRRGLAAGEPIRLFRDWFDYNLGIAADDIASVRFFSPDGIVSVDLVVPGAGLRVPAEPVTRGTRGYADYQVDMPDELLTPGAEHLYYFEATDAMGKVGRCPGNAPETCFEFSILPRGGDILIVDEAGHMVPGEREDYLHDVSYYYEEALGMLGHTWDRFDVAAAHHGALEDTNGPDWIGMCNYNTVFWITGDNYWPRPTASDAGSILAWLSSAPAGQERDILLAGNQQSAAGWDMLQVYNMYGGALLEPEFDVTPVLLEGAASWEFETGRLLAECPPGLQFDVVRRNPPVSGTEVVALYVAGGDTFPAAVVRTDAANGFQITTLGFGLEYVTDGPGKDALSGLANRLGIIAAAMEEMEVEPSGPGTGIAEVEARNALSLPHPNPFNPMTTVEYSVEAGGRVLAEVYDLSGRLVRTLLDSEVPAGTAGRLVWDGTDSRGAACASGVYFCRIQAPGLGATRKLVLLK